MTNKMNKTTNFWQELKRRRVISIIPVYAAAAFVVLELVDIIAEPLRLPDWTLNVVLVLLCVGFVISIIISWIYDFTEEGIKKTKPVDHEKTKPKETSIKATGWKIATYVSIVIIIGLLTLNIFKHKGLSAEIEKAQKSIAVLPFENMSDSDEYDHLGDAITDEIIMQLFKIKAFEVRSKTSIMQYKDTHKNSPLIGKELNVNYLLEGSVQRHGDKVRIRAQLIHAPTDDHIWAVIYPGEWKDIFEIQVSVAKQVAEELQAVLSPEEVKQIENKPTENSEAYNLYLKGRWFWNKWTDTDIEKGMSYFRQAIDMDPDFALAYAGLAEAYNTLSFYGQLAPEDSYPQARELALKALKIDDSIAEAHVALAFVKAYFEWDWDGSEQEFKKAIALDPDNITAHHLYAYFLVLQLRYDEALDEIDRALSLDPLNLITNRTLGDFYYHRREYDKAEEQLIKTLEMDSTFNYTHAYLGLVYLQKSLCEKALDELQKEISLAHGTNDIALTWKGYAYIICGNKEEGYAILNKLEELAEERCIPPSYFSWLYFALGENEYGFEWLEKAYEVRDPWLTDLKSNHFYDKIRSEARYNELLTRMNLSK